MLEVSSASAIVLLLTLGYVYYLVGLFGETKKIEPGTKFVKLPGVTRWIVVGAVSSQYQDVIRAPDQIVSANEAFKELLYADFTLFGKEIGDHLQIPVIVNKLNRSLGELLPEIHDEVVAAFDDIFALDGNEWKSFPLSPEVMKVVGRVSGRALVGLPLCRDMEYIRINVAFSVEVVLMHFVLTVVPASLRPLFTWLVSPNPRRVKQVSGYLQPLIDARREGARTQGDKYEKPFDFLTWLMESAEQHNRGDRDTILRMMVINFGSIHTTSLIFTNAIFALLAHCPHLVEPLRAEMQQCIDEDGWTKTAMDKMHLLDSFMKESQRYELVGAIAGHRLAIEDCTISGVFIPKGTLMAANTIDSHYGTAVWGPDAAEFDPYRFIKLEEQTGRKFTITTTSPNVLTFGHGRHACPGRFFAAQEMKAIMTHLLLNYDIKLPDSKTGAKPKNMWIGLNCLPNPKSRIMLRKRVETAGAGDANAPQRYII